MFIRYMGPIDEVTLVFNGAELGSVRRGEVIEVPDEAGAAYLVQGEIWKPAPAPRGQKSPTESAK